MRLNPRVPKTCCVLLATSLLFGVAVAVVKGGDAGVRDSLGNISAPWLLLPFIAGRTTRRPLAGASVGLLACLTALAGFYVAEAFVLDLGPHSVLTDLELTLPTGRVYVVAGLVCGPMFGALGGVRTPWRRGLDAAVVGLLLAGEPLTVYLYQRAQGMPPSESGMVTAYPSLWAGEVILGVLASALWLRAGRRRQRVQSGSPR
jgi:hypothetical protein